MLAACVLAPQTTAEESLFHDWESVCLGCAVARQYDPTLAMCPVVDCTNTSAAEVNHAILAASCTPGGACCQTTAEQDAFHVMMAYHDICDHDDAPQYVEVAVRCIRDSTPLAASAGGVCLALAGCELGVACLSTAVGACVMAGARL